MPQAVVHLVEDNATAIDLLRAMIGPVTWCWSKAPRNGHEETSAR